MSGFISCVHNLDLCTFEEADVACKLQESLDKQLTPPLLLKLCRPVALVAQWLKRWVTDQEVGSSTLPSCHYCVLEQGL